VIMVHAAPYAGTVKADPADQTTAALCGEQIVKGCFINTVFALPEVVSPPLLDRRQPGSFTGSFTVGVFILFTLVRFLQISSSIA